MKIPIPILLLTLLMAFCSCSPGFELHTGEHKHCPSGAIEELKKRLMETKQFCASLLVTPGDSNDDDETGTEE